MGCASKNLSPSKTEECDMRPWNLDASNETHKDPPDVTQGYLATCYGIFVYTKPSHFLKPNPESDQNSNLKPEKTNGPSRKSNRLNKI